jgi:predicted AAA+ superfamily ATPase
MLNFMNMTTNSAEISIRAGQLLRLAKACLISFILSNTHLLQDIINHTPRLYLNDIVNKYELGAVFSYDANNRENPEEVDFIIGTPGLVYIAVEVKSSHGQTKSSDKLLNKFIAWSSLIRNFPNGNQEALLFQYPFT